MDIEEKVKVFNFDSYKMVEEYLVNFDHHETHKIEAALLDFFLTLNDSHILNICNSMHKNCIKNKISPSAWSKVLRVTHQSLKQDTLSRMYRTPRVTYSMFKRINPEDFMNNKEYKKFLGLPSEIVVYRGGCVISGDSWSQMNQSAKFVKRGMCWTTDIKRAAWYAKNSIFHDLCEPIVIESTAKKENVIACLDYEDEFIIWRGKVTKMKICSIDLEEAVEQIKQHDRLVE